MLEKYRLPKALAAQIGSRRLHFFRDEDELPTSSNLSAGIDEALAGSRYLICILSPAYLESRWCMQEIYQFKAMHGGSNANIIPLVVTGDDPTRVFPEQLLHETRYFTDASGKQFAREVELEPLAGNVAAPTVRESLKKLKTEALRIAAPLFGVGFNDLYDRDRRRRAKRRNIILITSFAAVSLIALYSSLMLVRIYRQNRQIERQTLQLYENGMQMAMDAGAQVQAVQYARDALMAQLRMDGEASPETMRMLAKAAGLYEAGEGIDVRTRLSVSGGLQGVRYNTDGSALVVTGGGVTRVLDAHDGEERFFLPEENHYYPDERYLGKDAFFVFFGIRWDDDGTLATDEIQVVSYDLLSGKRSWVYRQDVRGYAEPKFYLTGNDKAGMVALVLSEEEPLDRKVIAVCLDAETGKRLDIQELTEVADVVGRLEMLPDGSLRPGERAARAEDVLAEYDEAHYVSKVSETQIEMHSSIPALNMRPLYGTDDGFAPEDVADHWVEEEDLSYAFCDGRFACLVRQYPDTDSYLWAHNMGSPDAVVSAEIPVYNTRREELLATIEVEAERDALSPVGILFTDDSHLLLYGWEGTDECFCMLYRTDGTLLDRKTFPVSDGEKTFLQAGRDASLLVMSGRVVSARNDAIVIRPFDTFSVTGARVDAEGRWAATVVFRDGDVALVAGEGDDWNAYTLITSSGRAGAELYDPVRSPEGGMVACIDAAEQNILIATADGETTLSIAAGEFGLPGWLMFLDEEALCALWGNGTLRCYHAHTGEELRIKETWSNPVGSIFRGMMRTERGGLVVLNRGYGLLLDAKTLAVCAEFPYFLCPAEGGEKIISRVDSVYEEGKDRDSAGYYIGDVLDTKELLFLSEWFLQGMQGN